MYRARVVAYPGRLRSLYQRVGKYRRDIEVAARKAYNEAAQPAIKALQDYPRQAVHPFRFATERSRRWYFAAISGKIPGVSIPTQNGRYQRTGDLGRAWQARLDVADNRIDFVIENNAFSEWKGRSYPIAALVYGPTSPRSRFRQVPGHRTTWGDRRAAKIIGPARTDFAQALLEALPPLSTDDIVRRNQ